MFIAIIGTRFSGKTSIENYLISSKGFTCVRISQDIAVRGLFHFKPFTNKGIRVALTLLHFFRANLHKKFRHSHNQKSGSTGSELSQTIYFSDTKELLNYVTENWRQNFVTCDLSNRGLIEPFIRRPFFLILQCSAPILERFRRFQSSGGLSLNDFIEEDDRKVFGTYETDPQTTGTGSLQFTADLVNIHVTNSFRTLQDLYRYLDNLDIMDPEHLRPSWDSYFMTLASLTSRRSNCMKRRVGAILVRQNRILASGYNGTPWGLKNCNDGGCSHCNHPNNSNSISNECLCLHAEENALLEAGRERIGHDCVLYCDTCPCLKCTIKIIQTGVKTVVYNLTYKVDDASAMLFNEAGVELRRFDPKSKFHLLPSEGGMSLLELEPNSVTQ